MLTRKQHELLLLIHRRLQAEGIPPSFDEMKDELELKSKSGIHRLITALEERGFIKRLPNRARALEVIRLPEGYEAKNDIAASSREKPSGFQPELVKGSLAANGLPGSSSGKLPAQDADNANNSGRGNVMQFERKGGLASRFRSSDSRMGEGGAQDASPRGFSESGETKALFDGQDRSDSSVAVPVMGKIAAGVPISAIQHITHSVSVPPSMLGFGNHFALQVQGDSMMGAGILDGDMVIIRETSAAEAGDIVVALVDDEEATLKRFSKSNGKVHLEAANPAYETRVLSADRVKVQGRLAGLVRKY